MALQNKKLNRWRERERKRWTFFQQYALDENGNPLMSFNNNVYFSLIRRSAKFG